MRLIDADALKEELGIAEDCDDCERLGAHGCVNSTWAIVCDRVDNAPTIDAVPVVRCKDCRHAVDYYHEGDCYCSNPKWGLNYFGGSWEFYCADAERRNNE